MTQKKDKPDTVKPVASGDRRASPENAGLPSGVENPRHREDFTSLLNVAVRKPEPKD